MECDTDYHPFKTGDFINLMNVLYSLGIIGDWPNINPCREVLLNRFETCSLRPN